MTDISTEVTDEDRSGQAAMAGAVTSAAEIAANDNGTKRVSHADLMRAVEFLSAAAQKEMNAGERLRAMEINGLILGTFKAAIRVEDEPWVPLHLGGDS